MDELTTELNDHHYRVAIFGSARLTETNPEYRVVYNLARLIASAGMDLVTGGGPGLMEAASTGHFAGKKDGSLRSIGLNIKLPREQRFSAHLDIKKQFEYFSERLDSFVALSDAFVVTPGGVGTILELFYTWQLAQVKKFSNKPVILLGDMWFDLVQWIRNWPLKNKLIDEEDLELIYLTRECEEAFTVIQEHFRHYKEGGEEFCRTYQRYRLCK
jgi:uncharacterized protein (TIGR00730 family)